MVAFPAPPLSFRTTGFPQYGFHVCLLDLFASQQCFRRSLLPASASVCDRTFIRETRCCDSLRDADDSLQLREVDRGRQRSLSVAVHSAATKPCELRADRIFRGYAVPIAIGSTAVPFSQLGTVQKVPVPLTSITVLSMQVACERVTESVEPIVSTRLCPTWIPSLTTPCLFPFLNFL